MARAGFDYVFEVSRDGNDPHLTTTYQKTISALGIADEEAHGRPLTAGGVPQAQTVRTLLTRVLAREWECEEDAIEIAVHGRDPLTGRAMSRLL